MDRTTVKTLLGVVVALGTLADLLVLHKAGSAITRDDVLIHAAFLLFAGVLIDPDSFKPLVFWRRDQP